MKKKNLVIGLLLILLTMLFLSKVSLIENKDKSNESTNTQSNLVLEPDLKLEEVGDHGLVQYSLQGNEGVLLCFHGTGGSAGGWSREKDDNLLFLKDMVAAGWSVVCPTSLNRDTKQWSPVNGRTNPDVVNVDGLLDDLGVSNEASVVLVGHSNGSGMISRYVAFSERGKNVVAAQFSNSAGIAPILAHEKYTVPSLFNYASCDNVINDNGPQENHKTLLEKGVPTELNKLDDVYEAGDYKNCHQFVNTGTKVLDLIE